MCAFSLSFTTTVFSQRSTRWLGAPPRRVAPKGQSSSLAQHRIEDRLHHQLLSTFVAHKSPGFGALRGGSGAALRTMLYRQTKCRLGCWPNFRRWTLRRSLTPRHWRALAGGLAVATMLAMIAGPVGASARAVTPKTPKVTRSLVYFIYNGPTPPYFGPMLSGANAVAKYYPNLDIKTLSANASAATEVTQIKEAVAAGAKGIRSEERRG